MMHSSRPPEKCSLCATQQSVATVKCPVCHDLGMKESVLCELHRSFQGRDDFVCWAFRPALRLVGNHGGKKHTTLATARKPAEYFPEVMRLLESGALNNDGACRCQSLPDLDAISSCMQYHAVWLTRERRRVFREGADYISDFCEILSRHGDLAAGRIFPMWLAPDHLHLYLKTAGNRPVEMIMQDLKQVVERELGERFPELAASCRGKAVWAQNYFVETIG